MLRNEIWSINPDKWFESTILSMGIMDTQKNINVLYLGFSGKLPGNASGEKAKLIAKALAGEGAVITILNRKFNYINRPEAEEGEDSELNEHGIRHLRVVNIKRSKNIIVRNIKKLLVPANEIRLIYTLNKKSRISFAIIVNRSIMTLLFYRIVSKIFGFKLLLNYMEYNSAMITRKRLTYRVNDYFYEKYAFCLIDGGLPISEFLKELMLTANPKLPILKIPVLVDLEHFKIKKELDAGKYFLYCGGAAFIDVVELVLKSFELLENGRIKLKLICHGSSDEIGKIKKLIQMSRKSALIELKYGLNYNELVILYQNALALLIPLRPTLQDRARFPHKVGEYAAAERPIISTNIGEVKYYFNNRESAFLVEDYNCAAFAKEMLHVLENPLLAECVGKCGKEIAVAHFDHKLYGKKIIQFYETIKNGYAK